MYHAASRMHHAFLSAFHRWNVHLGTHQLADLVQCLLSLLHPRALISPDSGAVSCADRATENYQKIKSIQFPSIIVKQFAEPPCRNVVVAQRTARRPAKTVTYFTVHALPPASPGPCPPADRPPDAPSRPVRETPRITVPTARTTSPVSNAPSPSTPLV